MIVVNKNEGPKIPYSVRTTKITFDDDLTINLCITDTGEHFFLKRTSGVLLVYPDAERENADSVLSCTRLQLLGLMMGSEEVMAAVHVDGDSTAPVRLVKYITPFSQTFNIVEP